jgi:hypothetical protein
VSKRMRPSSDTATASPRRLDLRSASDARDTNTAFAVHEYAPSGLHEYCASVCFNCRHMSTGPCDSIRVGRRPAFVAGVAMKPAGLAVSRTRRPAKPRYGADTAAPSRHQATHRHAGLVVARQRKSNLPAHMETYMWNRGDAENPHPCT